MDAYIISRSNTTAEQLVETLVFDANTMNNVVNETWATLGKCMFWEGVSSRSYVSDAMRSRADATAVFLPDTVIKTKRIRINGVREYSVEGDDDIANMGKVKVVYLRKIA